MHACRHASVDVWRYGCVDVWISMYMHGYLWIYIYIYRLYMWICMDMYGYVWMCMDMYECVWKGSGIVLGIIVFPFWDFLLDLLFRPFSLQFASVWSSKLAFLGVRTSHFP